MRIDSCSIWEGFQGGLKKIGTTQSSSMGPRLETKFIIAWKTNEPGISFLTSCRYVRCVCIEAFSRWKHPGRCRDVQIRIIVCFNSTRGRALHSQLIRYVLYVVWRQMLVSYSYCGAKFRISTVFEGMYHVYRGEVIDFTKELILITQLWNC